MGKSREMKSAENPESSSYWSMFALFPKVNGVV